MKGNQAHYHFIGIGGAGMSAIASVMLQLGLQVSGSDCSNREVLDRLAEQGAVVWQQHEASHIAHADYVVVSTAIPDDNVELVAARQQGIPVLPRAKALGLLMQEKNGVAVAGSHGKSTTTAMIGTVLSHAGLDPTVISGAEDRLTGVNGRLGSGFYLVAEADESDGSLIHLSPHLAVITNIDDDHMDHYGSMGNLYDTFARFLQGMKAQGTAILCGDDTGVRHVLERWQGNCCLYGFDAGNDWRLTDWIIAGNGSRFNVIHHSKNLGLIELNVPGRHNACNALAAVAAGHEAGIDFGSIREALRRFRGTRRRFEQLAEAGDISIYDDYAHHPTEIRATLQAARTLRPNRLLVVFQPHRYSRTRQLYREFASSLDLADHIWLMDIYPAGEKPAEGVHTRLVYDAMEPAVLERTTYSGGFEETVRSVSAQMCGGDMLLVMGAGDVRKVGEELADRLRSYTSP